MKRSAMNTSMLNLPFKTRVMEDNPYLESSRASLGSHELEVYVLDDGDQKTLRILLDRALIYKSGDVMPSAEWFTVCREGGYRPRLDWDRDPVSILFHGVLPLMAEHWTEFQLPYDKGGFPEGVESLATLQKAHAAFIANLEVDSESGAVGQIAEMFTHLPLRAVVLHDRPEQRVDYLGNALDEAYVGIDLILGKTQGNAARLGKVSLSSTGGMRWSPWLAGGRWANHGREFTGKEKATDFLRASGLSTVPAEGFQEAFEALIENYAVFMEEVVDRYLADYPAAILWHRDPVNQYLQHSVVKAEQAGQEVVLTFDNGLKARVAHSNSLKVQPEAEKQPEAIQSLAKGEALE